MSFPANVQTAFDEIYAGMAHKMATQFGPVIFWDRSDLADKQTLLSLAALMHMRAFSDGRWLKLLPEYRQGRN